MNIARFAGAVRRKRRGSGSAETGRARLGMTLPELE